MSAFTSVSSTLAAGTVGQLGYGSDADLLVRSYVLEDATAVPPGRGVAYDATNDSVQLFVAGHTQFMGVAFDDGSLALDTTAFSATGNPNVPVLKRGQVWVLTTTAVTPADGVFCQNDASGAGPLGSFRNDNNGGKATQITAGVQWAGSYSSGKALLQINLPA